MNYLLLGLVSDCIKTAVLNVKNVSEIPEAAKMELRKYINNLYELVRGENMIDKMVKASLSEETSRETYRSALLVIAKRYPSMTVLELAKKVDRSVLWVLNALRSV